MRSSRKAGWLLIVRASYFHVFVKLCFFFRRVPYSRDLMGVMEMMRSLMKYLKRVRTVDSEKANP